METAGRHHGTSRAIPVKDARRIWRSDGVEPCIARMAGSKAMAHDGWAQPAGIFQRIRRWFQCALGTDVIQSLLGAIPFAGPLENDAALNQFAVIIGRIPQPQGPFGEQKRVAGAIGNRIQS